jgi:hypothetical protein
MLYYRHVELLVGLCQYSTNNQKLKAVLMENDKEIITLKSEENSEVWAVKNQLEVKKKQLYNV